MKTDQIFIGNIRRCTKYEEKTMFRDELFINGQCICSSGFGHIEKDDELFKENAVLIKIKNGGYVDLERLNSILDHIKIHKDITSNGYRLGGLMMSTSAHALNCLFVDSESLKPYYENEQTRSVSVNRLKKEINRSK